MASDERDYEWCAETMLERYGPMALKRAERRASERLLNRSQDGYEIWAKVAATIRRIQSGAQTA